VKRHTYLLTYAVCTFLLLGACKDRQTIGYYRHVDFSGFHNINLRYPADSNSNPNHYLYKVKFSKNGRIMSVECPIEGLRISDKKSGYSILNISYSKYRETWSYIGIEDSAAFGDSGICYDVYTIDQNCPASLIHLNSDRKIIDDSLGVAIYEFRVNKSGHISESYGLDIRGDTVVDGRGYYHTLYKYDDSGNLIEKSNIGKNDSLLENNDGLAIIRDIYDSLGNCLEERYLDSKGKLKSSKKFNAAVLKYAYDNNGNVTEAKLFGENGNLADTPYPYYPILKMRNNENDQVVEIDYCHKNGNALKIMKFTPRGNNTAVFYYDSTGTPIVDAREGYAVNIVKYDKNDHILETSYYDEDNKLIIPKSMGFAQSQMKYNRRNNLMEIKYFGPDGKLIKDPECGCAMQTFQYDYENLRVVATCRGIDGSIENGKYGYAIRKSKYDKHQNLVEDKYFDKWGKIITDATFDRNGKRVD